MNFQQLLSKNKKNILSKIGQSPHTKKIRGKSVLLPSRSEISFFFRFLFSLEIIIVQATCNENIQNRDMSKYLSKNCPLNQRK